jgi:DNA-directed RNA polymerase specialized sigma subunit
VKAGELSAAQRDRLIWHLRHVRRWSLERIAHEVGLTRSGVSRALARVSDGHPGRDTRAQ